MITTSPRERDAPGEVRGDEAADERADGGGDRGGGADERVGAALHRPLEVPVDQRLHRRQQQRRAEAADDRPEDDDRQEALGQRHRERADRVPEQADDVRALAAEEVADLAADQDERRGDQRLEGDRGLDAARGRVEVVHDRRDRDVHQRRVDDEHEHRHREQDRDELVAARLLGGSGGGFGAHDANVVAQLGATSSRADEIQQRRGRGRPRPLSPLGYRAY